MWLERLFIMRVLIIGDIFIIVIKEKGNITQFGAKTLINTIASQTNSFNLISKVSSIL